MKRIANLASRIYPLQIPLPADEEKGWKPYPLFNGRTSGLRSLSCHTSVLINNHSPHPPHTHAEEEILLVLGGEVDLLLPQLGQSENHTKRLKTGEFVYYPAQFPHTLRTVSPEPADYLMFRWQGESKKNGSHLFFGHFDIFEAFKQVQNVGGFKPKLVFEGETDYLKKLHCHVSVLEPGSGYDLHSDPYTVAIIVLEGEVLTLGQRATAHNVIFYAPGQPHDMFNPGSKPAKYIVFEFHGRTGLKTYLKKFVSSFLIGKNKVDTTQAYTRPRSVCLDASSVCQLKCPSCPTAAGLVAKGVGTGFLSLANFKKFINKNPWVSDIELSKWGEIFLNPELKRIIQFAYKNNVVLRADNGANLNKAADDVLEALVKYKFRSLTCSIDGASQGTYSIYRVNGDYGRVIDNIRRINYYKTKYRSSYPNLRWQFIAFGHNEHEIGKARAIAQELNMKFYLKLSWDDLYTGAFSPVKDQELIRKESDHGVANRQDFEKKYGRHYINEACHELWLLPRVNFNGKLLGCCVNHWTDFGNVFESGLEKCLSSESLDYAKQMLLGLKQPRADIPCSTCKIYESRKRNNSWVNLSKITDHYVESRKMNMVNNRLGNPFFSWLKNRLDGVIST